MSSPSRISAGSAASAAIAAWRDARVRAAFWQGLLLLAVATLLIWLASNARQALEQRGMTSGFDFLREPANFALGDAFFTFKPGQTYLAAFAVGVGNTLMLSAVSIVTAMAMGATLGLARLSRNRLVSGLAHAYVALFRNTPQLVQIIFWYSAFTLLPDPRRAFSLFNAIYASNRGLTIPVPEDGGAALTALLMLGFGALSALALSRVADRSRRRTGRRWRGLSLMLALVVLGPAIATWAFAGAPLTWSTPKLRGFNFTGGATMAPEFLAIFFGLSFYIAAFIAEIVRAGVLSVDAGQIEAAQSVGLTRRDVYRKVVAPQALRVAMPPLAAQFISLLKNSSLGVAVGYPDLFSISNTMLTYSGRTIEVIAIMTLVYLVLSLAIGAAAEVVNRAMLFAER